MTKKKKPKNIKRKSQIMKERSTITLYDYENADKNQTTVAKTSETEKNKKVISNISKNTITELAVTKKDLAEYYEDEISPVSSESNKTDENECKKDLNQPPYRGPIRQGDVMWARFAFPTQPELVKVRPVVVVQENTNYNTLTVVPLTSSQQNSQLYTRVPLNYNNLTSYAEIECLSTIDRKDVYSYQRSLNWKDYRRVQIGIFDHLGIF